MNNETTYANAEEWLSSRRNSIGASDSPTLFGCGYASQSPMTLFADKMDGTDAVHLSSEEEKRLQRGKALERGIADVLQVELGKSSRVITNERYAVARNPDNPHMTATVDGYVYRGSTFAVLELKAVSHWAADEWADGIPDRVAIQVQHQLACVPEASHAIVMPLINSLDGDVIEIQRDPVIQQMISDEVHYFWEAYVAAEKMPPVDARECTGRAIARLHPADNGQVVELPAELDDLCHQLAICKRLRGELNEKIQGAKNAITAAIGSATYGHLNGHSYSLKTTTRKNEAREAYESTYRTLRPIKSLPKTNQEPTA